MISVDGGGPFLQDEGTIAAAKRVPALDRVTLCRVMPRSIEVSMTRTIALAVALAVLALPAAADEAVLRHRHRHHHYANPSPMMPRALVACTQRTGCIPLQPGCVPVPERAFLIFPTGFDVADCEGTILYGNPYVFY